MTARRVPHRLRLQGERGSMAFDLVIAVVGLALSALLVPMVVTSSNVTRSDTSRVRALDAAQAGLNVMIGTIRNAKTGMVGTSTMLPCDPVSGSLGGSSRATYRASVVYFFNNPANASSTQMTCRQGYGPYDPGSQNFTPRYAQITSLGRDGTASNGSTQGRTLQTTYVFKITNSNIVGGRIRIYPSSAAQMCMDAGTSTPIAGAQLSLQPCTDPPTSQQIFAYRNDLTLQLLSSITPAYPDGLCLDLADTASATSPIVFAACKADAPPVYSQQWSFNDNGNFEAAKPNSAKDGILAGRCITTATQGAGQQIGLGACGSTVSTTSAWIPSPAIGPGAAKAPQLINFYEFGRCLDVTNQDVTIDHLIAYPCKQNPYPSAVTWNQRFTLPPIADDATTGTGRISTTNANGDFCLTTPGTLGGYATMKRCDGSSAQTWTVYNGNAPLTYDSKHQIVDNGGRCLGLTDPKGGEVWSAIDVETCAGTADQKWNAPSDLTDSAQRDTKEIKTAP